MAPWYILIDPPQYDPRVWNPWNMAVFEHNKGGEEDEGRLVPRPVDASSVASDQGWDFDKNL